MRTHTHTHTHTHKAWVCSRAYNRLLHHLGNKPCFHYLTSGGDVSLIISNELPEDDPPLGIINSLLMPTHNYDVIILHHI